MQGIAVLGFGISFEVGAVIDSKSGKTRPYLTLSRAQGVDFSVGIKISQNKSMYNKPALNIYSIEGWSHSRNGSFLIFDGSYGGDEFRSGIFKEMSDKHYNYESYNFGLSLGLPIGATATKGYTWVFW